MSQSIARQTLIEHQTLKHVTEALRIVLNWQAPDAGLPRKLTSLRFVTGSLQRHMQYMLGLEEQDGYMPQVMAMSPQFAKEVATLRLQHDEFRLALQEIVAQLEAVTADDPAQVSEICKRLTELLDKLDAHSKLETSLVQEAFLREEGGEG
ncbi:MAG: hemerythrin domain-containing protein [Planctomycetes bacterium]|nr:hemerythrin domain-containing protein [Planctomycetota bacterium]